VIRITIAPSCNSTPFGKGVADVTCANAITSAEPPISDCASELRIAPGAARKTQAAAAAATRNRMTHAPKERNASESSITEGTQNKRHPTEKEPQQPIAELPRLLYVC
jgi:hypothetical protein